MSPPDPVPQRRPKGGGLPFAKRIRLERDAYREWNVAFHLTIDAHPAARWPESLCAALWESIRTADRIELVAACLMPDHVHLLVRRNRLDIIEFLNEWKSWTTRLGWKHGLKGGIWQPGMWDTTIVGDGQFSAVHDYIVRNPVTAGFVEDALDWPWTWSRLWDD
ncbi:MAG: transposase [Dehalococcoidia bacterium]